MDSEVVTLKKEAFKSFKVGVKADTAFSSIFKEKPSKKKRQSKGEQKGE